MDANRTPVPVQSGARPTAPHRHALRYGTRIALAVAVGLFAALSLMATSLAALPSRVGPRHAPMPVPPLGNTWVWPLDGIPRVVRPFEPPPRPWLPGHRGVDLAGQPAVGVRSAGTGVVAFAGLVAGRPVVSVAHANGLRTTYEPVAATVQIGQQLRAGDPLGTLVAGHLGCPLAACLHWGLRRGETYLDPLLLIRPWQIRLKPL